MMNALPAQNPVSPETLKRYVGPEGITGPAHAANLALQAIQNQERPLAQFFSKIATDFPFSKALSAVDGDNSTISWKDLAQLAQGKDYIAKADVGTVPELTEDVLKNLTALSQLQPVATNPKVWDPYAQASAAYPAYPSYSTYPAPYAGQTPVYPPQASYPHAYPPTYPPSYPPSYPAYPSYPPQGGGYPTQPMPQYPGSAYPPSPTYPQAGGYPSPYAQAPYPQAPYGAAPTDPYAQGYNPYPSTGGYPSPYAQTPYPQAPYAQNAQMPYGADPYNNAGFGTNQGYGQMSPYPQASSYGQNAYGAAPSAYPPAYPPPPPVMNVVNNYSIYNTYNNQVYNNQSYQYPTNNNQVYNNQAYNNQSYQYPTNNNQVYNNQAYNNQRPQMNMNYNQFNHSGNTMANMPMNYNASSMNQFNALRPVPPMNTPYGGGMPPAYGASVPAMPYGQAYGQSGNPYGGNNMMMANRPSPYGAGMFPR